QQREERDVCSNDSARLSSMMFVLPEFWRVSDCVRIRTAMDRGRTSCAEIYDDGYRVDDNARRAFDVDVDDDVVGEVQRAIDATRLSVAEFFGTSLSGEEGPGFLRYASGGFYRIHRDVAPGWEHDFPRRISVVVFLTTAGAGCEGGSLRLYAEGERLDIAPRAGTLV